MKQLNFVKISFVLFFLISCIDQKGIRNSNLKDKGVDEIHCNDEISPLIEIWNHTGNDYLIGKHNILIDEYVKSDGWNSEDNPFPKKYDVKVILVSNERLFDNENYKIPRCTISIDVSYYVGFNNDSEYPLNSYIFDRHTVVSSKIIENFKFKENNQKSNSYEFIISGIELEEIHRKVKMKKQFLNQLIFNIQIKNEKNNCNYEYRFPINKN